MPKLMLYHATYAAYLPFILSQGLKPDTGKNNDGLSYDEPVICLAADPDVAESFAETADAVPDDIFDSGIVVLMVIVQDDINLYIDPNVKQTDDDIISYVCKKSIPPECISVLK